MNLIGPGTFTSRFWHTEKTAQKSANYMTRVYGRYFTTIKGTPHTAGVPNECWAVTDRWCQRK